MKMNIALHILIATIVTASRAHARIPSFVRDPRTVEAKEDVRRQAMGDHQLSSVLDTDLADGTTCRARLVEAEETFQNDFSLKEAKSLACSVVSEEFPECRGCQGYWKTASIIHLRLHFHEIQIPLSHSNRMYVLTFTPTGKGGPYPRMY